MDRPLEEQRRLERQLVTLRWIVAAFGAAQVAFAVRDGGHDPNLAVPLGCAIVLSLMIGNLLLGREVDGANERRLATVGVIAFALDAAAIMGLIVLATDGPADPVWVIGYVLPLEGAARWGLTGALIGAGIFIGSQVATEAYAQAARPRLSIGGPALAFRGGMAIVIGVVAGSLASSLTRAAADARVRARDVEAAADRAEAAAAREEQARREVALFHATVLAETEADRLRGSLQTTADAIARELGCAALGILVRGRGPVGEPQFEAMGVHGDPGYLAGQELSPRVHPVAAAASDGTPIRAERDLVAPMMARGEVVGAIHERTDDETSGDDRLLVLARLGDQLGLVLESTRLRADQEATVTRLRELDQMKSDFVAVTSHELRTPLAGIRGFVDMLRRRGGDLSEPEREEYLGIVLTQTDRLIALVDDLLVVSRIEAGMLALEPTEIEVQGFLGSVARTFGDDARIDVARLEGAPDTMIVDPRRLTQILTNLLHNALKFSPAGAPVTVRWGAPAEGVVSFAVMDRGPGIDEVDLGKVFERFHQAESANEHSEGFGLGLYITRQLCEAMGGWIEVRSVLGDGATFTVTLPTIRPMGAPARSSATTHPDRTAS
jgi:signal transduction histidine kinase